MPSTSAHRENIPDLPPTYRTTTNGDPFLVNDSGVGDEEIVGDVRVTGRIAVFGRFIT